MAGSLKTKNYQLAKYAPDDITSWLTDFNGNMDLIDAGMQANKQAATQAQDSVDNLEAEYASLLTVVNGHTTSIDANEKAIAANTASIAELGDEVNNISIGDVIIKLQTNGTVVEPILTGMTVALRKLGNYASGSAMFSFATGQMHAYDRMGTGLFSSLYITDIVRFTGNAFNLTPDIWTPLLGCANQSTTNDPRLVEMCVAYLSDTNYTIIGWAKSNADRVDLSESIIGSVAI